MKRKFLLTLAAVAAMVVGTQNVSAVNPPSKDGAKPEVGKTYYLYNIAAGAYMNHGSSWGTHVTVDAAGAEITLGGAEGAYTIHQAGIDASKYQTEDGWSDNTNAGKFSFDAAEADGYTNVFYIHASGGNYYYWGGGVGQYGDEAYVASAPATFTDAYKWILVPATDRTAMTTGNDVSYLIKNPDFTGYALGWGKACTTNWTGDGVTNYAAEGDQATYYSGQFAEKWTAAPGTLANISHHQTLSGLPAGKYTLSVNAQAIQQDGGSAGTGAYIYAGEEKTELGLYGTYSVDFKSTGADIEIGVKTISTSANWLSFDKFRLTYNGADIADYVEPYNTAKKNASAVDQTKDMNSTILSDLKSVISKYADKDAESFTTVEGIKAATEEFTNATTVATKSIEQYATAPAALQAQKVLIECTNVYDAEAFATYKSNYESLKEKYEAKTLTNEEAVVNPSVATGWHASTAYNFLLTPWKVGETACNNFDAGMYINTWSNEGDTDGSNFKVPFFEYWTNDDKSLGENTLTATVKGLTSGQVYKVISWTRVRIKNSETNAATGITFQVNDGHEFPATIGSQIGETQFRLAEITAYGTADTDGNLYIKYNVASDNNISWLSFKNVKYVESTELEMNKAIYAQYYAKIEEAEACYKTLDSNKEYAASLKSAIDNAKAWTPTEEGVNAATDALQTAIDAAKQAVRQETYANLADGKYIFAAKESGKFLGAGNSWGTQASLLNDPEYVEIAKCEDGKYTIKSQVSNGGSNQYFNGTYMDGAATEFEIMPTDGGYLICDGTKYYGGETTVAPQTDEFVWTITSLADMDAKMASATAEAPMNITYKVLDPNFGRNNVNWSSLTNTNVQTNGDNANKVAESWHKANFYLGQTINNLPAGTYEIKCNAVYTTDADKLPYIFVNGVKTTFNKTNDTYTSAADYATSFASGNYPIDLKVYVKTGILSLGAACEDNSKQWSVWDNFQLFYLGSEKADGVEESEADITRSIENGNFGTICLPSAFSVEGAKVYSGEINAAKDAVILTEVKTPAAGVPYIYQATADSQTFTCTGSENLSKAGKAETANGLTLQGIFEATAAPKGSYVLQNNKFCFVVDGKQPTLSAYKAYLTLPEEAAPEAKEISIDFAGEATAVKAVNALVNGNAKIYDVNGRQLGKLQKGINIVNGVKVVVK